MLDENTILTLNYELVFTKALVRSILFDNGSILCYLCLCRAFKVLVLLFYFARVLVGTDTPSLVYCATFLPVGGANVCLHQRVRHCSLPPCISAHVGTYALSSLIRNLHLPQHLLLHFAVQNGIYHPRKPIRHAACHNWPAHVLPIF